MFASIIAYGLIAYALAQATRVVMTDNSRVLLRGALLSSSAIVGSILVFAIN